MSAVSDQVKLAHRARLQLIFLVIGLGLTVLAAVVPVWIEGSTSL